MRIPALTIVAALASISAAHAQPAPAAPAAPAAQPGPAAPLDANTPLETLMAAPVSRSAVLKQFPDLDKHPAYEQVKAMSLRALQPLASDVITEEKIVALEAELKAAK